MVRCAPPASGSGLGFRRRGGLGGLRCRHAPDLVADVVGEAPEGEIVPDFSAAPAPKAAATAGAEEAAPSEAAELFDPSTAKVDEVIAYVAGADDAERARVLEAEKAGKARKTLIEKLSA